MTVKSECPHLRKFSTDQRNTLFFKFIENGVEYAVNIEELLHGSANSNARLAICGHESAVRQKCQARIAEVLDA